MVTVLIVVGLVSLALAWTLAEQVDLTKRGVLTMLALIGSSVLCLAVVLSVAVASNLGGR
jgi:hypothetical protein